jgi:hypothetical protein
VYLANAQTGRYCVPETMHGGPWAQPQKSSLTANFVDKTSGPVYQQCTLGWTSCLPTERREPFLGFARTLHLLGSPVRSIRRARVCLLRISEYRKARYSLGCLEVLPFEMSFLEGTARYFGLAGGVR